RSPPPEAMPPQSPVPDSSARRSRRHKLTADTPPSRSVPHRRQKCPHSPRQATSENPSWSRFPESRGQIGNLRENGVQRLCPHLAPTLKHSPESAWFKTPD